MEQHVWVFASITVSISDKGILAPVLGLRV